MSVSPWGCVRYSTQGFVGLFPQTFVSVPHLARVSPRNFVTIPLPMVCERFSLGFCERSDSQYFSTVKKLVREKFWIGVY